VCLPDSSNPDCSALRAAVDREKNSRNVADIALMTGALLGGATLAAWLLIPDITRTELGSIKAAPWIARGGSGVSVSGSY
jgi:hypothetical protein